MAYWLGFRVFTAMARVQSVVRELRTHKPCGTANNNNKKNPPPQIMHLIIILCTQGVFKNYSLLWIYLLIFPSFISELPSVVTVLPPEIIL